MIFNWYKIFNLNEFTTTGLVSRTVSLFLEDIGPAEVLITKGNTVAMTYNDAFLPVEFLNQNPYVFKEGGYAVYRDSNSDIWLGVEVIES